MTPDGDMTVGKVVFGENRYAGTFEPMDRPSDHAAIARLNAVNAELLAACDLAIASRISLACTSPTCGCMNATTYRALKKAVANARGLL